MRFEPCPSIRDAKVQAWAVVDKRRLLALDERTSLPVDVRAAGPAVVSPKLARVVSRTFQAPGTFQAPISERRDLVFATMFGDDVEKLVGSTTGGLEVLRFMNGMHGKDVVVTSGLSSPEKAPAAPFREKDPRTIGAGYELIVLCDRGDSRLSDQLVAMLRETASRGTHLLPGEWIWFEGDTLPDSDIGGFLLAPPTTFPDKFPVAGGVAYFTLFLPVTVAEVHVARKGVLDFVARMNDNGIRDFSPMRRASIPGTPPYEPPPPPPPEAGLLDAFDAPSNPMRFIAALQRVLSSSPSFEQLQALAPPMLLVIGPHALDFDINGNRVSMSEHDPRSAAPRTDPRVSNARHSDALALS